LRRCHRAALPLAGDTHPALRMALLASLTGAATQSLVDGVLVMPTTLVWLCLLAGWAWALCEPPAQSAAPIAPLGPPAQGPIHPAPWRSRLWLALPFLLASLYLLWSVAQQLPYLHWPEHSGWSPIGLGLSPFPRFWSHGMIEPSP